MGWGEEEQELGRRGARCGKKKGRWWGEKEHWVRRGGARFFLSQILISQNIKIFLLKENVLSKKKVSVTEILFFYMSSFLSQK